MAGISLKSYIIQRKLELYEEMMDAREQLDDGQNTSIELAILESRLREVEALEKICKERGRY